MSFGKSSPTKDDDASINTSQVKTIFGGAKAEAFLGPGSKVVGVLTFGGPVELDGFIEGEIHAKDQLVIGESAVVNAKVLGVEIVVRGTVHGDILASKKLSLRKPAKIVGNISCASLSIEEGVVLEGKCSMGAPNAHQKESSSPAPSKGEPAKPSEPHGKK